MRSSLAAREYQAGKTLDQDDEHQQCAQQRCNASSEGQACFGIFLPAPEAERNQSAGHGDERQKKRYPRYRIKLMGALPWRQGKIDLSGCEPRRGTEDKAAPGGKVA